MFQKLVHNRRGGYCFEQNQLFLRALTALGFDTRPLLARVVLGADGTIADARIGLNGAANRTLPRLALAEIQLCAPVERQEIWAAGVTYLRSKTARMEESDFSATAYDRVYAAARPEIFFKALAEKVVATGGTVGIRRDARWSVPEPMVLCVLRPA